MTIFSTIVGIIEGGAVQMADTVEHEGGLWIVPAWSAPQADGLIYPNRLIRIDKLKLQKMPINSPYGADYSLGDPLPKALFDAEIPPELKGRFDVIERPQVGFRPQTSH